MFSAQNQTILACFVIMVLARRTRSPPYWSKGMISDGTQSMLLFNLRLKLSQCHLILTFVPIVPTQIWVVSMIPFETLF